MSFSGVVKTAHCMALNFYKRKNAKDLMILAISVIHYTGPILNFKSSMSVFPKASFSLPIISSFKN